MSHYILFQYICLMLGSFTLSATSTPHNTQRTFRSWESEWAPIYADYQNIIESPELLADYFKDTVKSNNTIKSALNKLGLSESFYFGASSSSYQIEGDIGDENSWTPFVRHHNKEIARNAIVFWESYMQEHPEERKNIQDTIAKWHAYQEKVVSNTTTTQDTKWARKEWEKIYGNPNKKTAGILENLKNKTVKTDIKSATKHKRIREYVGKAIDFWNQYKNDFNLLKRNFGINAFRISIEWSKIQPEHDVWNMQALAHYRKIIKSMKKNGIEPIVVLHHYTIPTWFESIGGFEQRGNIGAFVEFASKVYEELADLVTLWSTFNAVEGYAFKGYYTLDGAPGLVKDMVTTQTVIAHMLESHVRIYKTFKDQYKKRIAQDETIPEPQIGIQKNILPLDATGLNPLSYIGAYMGNKLQNDGYYSFFKKGQFKVSIPVWLGTITHPVNPIKEALNCLDWIGINHYSNAYMQGLERKKETKPDRTTLNPNYRFYPEGLYRSVQHLYNKMLKSIEKKTGKKIPIIITENGAALGDNKEKRMLFYQRALFTIAQAIQDGYTVIGYTPWSHADNYEWGSPYGKKRYGLLHVDFTNSQLIRTVQYGAEFYGNFVKQFLHNNSN